MGSYKPDVRELDDETVRRARLTVETREAALEEAGDLLLPIERGVISPSDVVADLRELVNGKPVRTQPEDITVFKSVGVAFEDLVIASAAFKRSAAHLAKRSLGA
jgi:ornithine cyclodeaminase/alanine dehydrogenase-like protein (mu-crystallin family)